MNEQKMEIIRKTAIEMMAPISNIDFIKRVYEQQKATLTREQLAIYLESILENAELLLDDIYKIHEKTF